MRPTEANIEKRSLSENVTKISRALGTTFWAVVKADAYGHGALDVATLLEGRKELAGFAVSLVEEAVELRDGGITDPVMVMGPSFVDAHNTFVDHNLLPMVSSKEDIRKFVEIGKARNKPVRMHLKFDTGMGRLGLDPKDLVFVESCIADDCLQVTGLSSHFACADNDSPSDVDCLTNTQLNCFVELVTAVKKKSNAKLVFHVANSAGAAKFSKARFDQSRIGLALYGGGVGASYFKTDQVMTIKSHVAQTRDIECGRTIGYEKWFTSNRLTKAAVIPIGYADGYPRKMGRSAKVLIHGQKCPVLGAVSMDMVVADVTDTKQAVKVGDEVVLLGAQKGVSISLSDFSNWSGQSEYEAVCGISKRVPRVMS